MNIDVTIYNNIIKHRSPIFGFAIIMIILYHWMADAGSLQKFFLPFNKGYIGCDIFYFLSAFGLCFSLKKHKLSEFYKRRVLRIYPLFFCLTTYTSALAIRQGSNLSCWDWICNLSGLSYFNIGGQFHNWFISSILLMYVILPLLYKICELLGNYSFYITLVSAFLCIMLFKPIWYYDCFIARIPVFVFGILYFQQRGNLLMLKWPLLAHILFIQLAYNTHETFLWTAMFMPILIVFLIVLCESLSERFYSLLSYIGSKSIELFFGNIIARSIIRQLQTTDINGVLLYIPTNLIGGVFFIALGLLFTKLLYHSKKTKV